MKSTCARCGSKVKIGADGWGKCPKCGLSRFVAVQPVKPAQTKIKN
jgi:DNA-directed RNA polymerase subunit RPC12/RpoP